MNLELILKDLKDPYVRENFVRIHTALLTVLFSDNFKFYEKTFPACTRLAVAHGLNYTPKDAWFTSILGDQNFYFNYQDFDSKNIYVTADGPCTVRFFVGSYDGQGLSASVKKVDGGFSAPGTVKIAIDGGGA